MNAALKATTQTILCVLCVFVWNYFFPGRQASIMCMGMGVATGTLLLLICNYLSGIAWDVLRVRAAIMEIQATLMLKKLEEKK